MEKLWQSDQTRAMVAVGVLENLRPQMIPNLMDFFEDDSTDVVQKVLVDATYLSKADKRRLAEMVSSWVRVWRREKVPTLRCWID